jgi:chromosome partitioning protein
MQPVCNSFGVIGMASKAAHCIVFANEKGGTGKSTTCVHTAVALAAQGLRIAVLDLDHRQRTVTRYLDNRADTMRRRSISLPLPSYAVFEGQEAGQLDEAIDTMGAEADVVVIDTPGRDDPMARHAATRANTLVTPINDSFVDFDLIGQVDPETFKVRRLSFYAELMWETRKTRAKTDGVSIDWVLLRNRLHHMEARNQKRVGEALGELSKRVGFRVIPGLSERVIFRELFPSGLTLLDKGHLGELGISHVAARQELREMVAGLALPQLGERSATERDAA